MLHPFRAYGIPPGGYPPDYHADERPYFMRTLVIVIVTGLLALGWAAIYIARQPQCVQSHTERRWKEAYTTHPYMTSSNLALRMQTRRHPAQWETVTICDKYQEK